MFSFVKSFFDNIVGKLCVSVAKTNSPKINGDVQSFTTQTTGGDAYIVSGDMVVNPKPQSSFISKEVFDQISIGIEGIYSVLGTVKSYCKILKEYEPEGDYRAVPNTFVERYLDLCEKLHTFSLICEKYDFLLDPENMEISKTPGLSKQLCAICSEIKYELDLKQNKIERFNKHKFDAKLLNLSDICSEINLHSQRVRNLSKELLKKNL